MSDLAKPTCIMCGRPVGPKAATYELRDSEKHIMRVLLQEDKPVVFCRACDGISKDPKAFSEFMRGFWLTWMRRRGVPMVVAERYAQRVHDFYLSKALKPAS